MRHGPQIIKDGVRFSIWAPKAERVELYLPESGVDVRSGAAPGAGQREKMQPAGGGFYTLDVANVAAGIRYGFVINGSVFPDPASVHQPDGVHGLSRVVDTHFTFSDEAFVPVLLEELVLYEVHIGTFTEEGTFAAAATRFSELRELGITGVEIMPISQFPGARNWGYDGTYLYAAQESYGGPDEFATLVDAAHAHGLSVYLDLVYNHMGPEGNYSGHFGPYFTNKYQTPWGDAVNVDGPGSDAVRAYLLGAARQWLEEFHVDGFRLDAVHEIHDESGVPFLRELSDLASRISAWTGKRRTIIAESDLNERRLVMPAAANGMGLDAAWADDFHHAVHAYLTGERKGYYADFDGTQHIARALEAGWSYRWNYSESRDRHHGTSPDGLPQTSFVFCTQNHDQVGNRMLGERLGELAGLEAERAARVLLLLAPYVPLLFMGQEYGERRPFLYIIDHSDQGLVEATREGRKREFAAFHESGEPPDPASSKTAKRSVLAWAERGDNEHAEDLELTKTLLQLRAACDCFRPTRRVCEGDRGVRAFASGSTIAFASCGANDHGLVVVNLGSSGVTHDFATLCDATGFVPEKAGTPVLERNARREGVESKELSLDGYGAWATVRRFARE